MHGEGAVRRFGSKAHSSPQLRHRRALCKYICKKALVKFSEVPNQHKHIVSQIPTAVTHPMCAGTSVSTGMFLENQAIISQMSFVVEADFELDSRLNPVF